jgi:hypothetical protein
MKEEIKTIRTYKNKKMIETLSKVKNLNNFNMEDLLHQEEN